MNEIIDSFSGDNSFLSNFFPYPVILDGDVYQNAESAFQAQKTTDPVLKREFLSLTPNKAKYLGKHITLRPNWDEIRVDEMRKVLIAKFSDPFLLKKLLDTGEKELIEGNTWGDRFWGVCDGLGDNTLGKLLMEIRDETRYFLEKLTYPEGRNADDL